MLVIVTFWDMSSLSMTLEQYNELNMLEVYEAELL